MEKSEIKKIRSDAHAHGTYNDMFKSFRGEKKLITIEEKNIALEKYNKLKQEKINSIKPGQLMFVGMGMENETDIGNYRIRTYIKREDGRNFFVEIGSNEKGMHVDHTIDVDQQRYFEKQLNRLFKIGRDNRTEKNRGEYKIFEKQPYHWYRTDEARDFLKGKEPTKQNVLDFVNFIFETNFKTMEVDNYLLTTDDYISFE